DVGVAFLNGLALVGIAVVAHRRGGPLLTTAAMATAAGLTWTMGSEVLIAPVQTASLVLPFLCFLALLWGVSCGDVALLPWVAGVASLLVQTHVVFAFLVPTLTVFSLVMLGLELRRRPAAGT